MDYKREKRDELQSSIVSEDIVHKPAPYTNEKEAQNQNRYERYKSGTHPEPKSALGII
jgi:hypothetical protein